MELDIRKGGITETGEKYTNGVTDRESQNSLSRSGSNKNKNRRFEEDACVYPHLR